DVRGLGNAALDSLIRQRDIDILVDLNGHTAGNRLAALARRPAPIQVTYMGYPGTLGADFIDYVIADRIVLPDSDRRFFMEQPVWMPDCYQVSDSTQRSATVPSRLDERLPARGFVFASFNAAHKIMPSMWATWMRLLKGVEGSVLWLVAANETARARLLRAA